MAPDGDSSEGGGGEAGGPLFYAFRVPGFIWPVGRQRLNESGGSVGLLFVVLVEAPPTHLPVPRSITITL